MTPDNYEPPGFERSTDAKFSFPTKTLNIKLGNVDTKIHGYVQALKTFNITIKTFNNMNILH